MSALDAACVLYVFFACVGALAVWSLFYLSDHGDAMERGETEDLLHQTGMSRAGFIVAGGFLWPVIVIIGLKGMISGE